MSSTSTSADYARRSTRDSTRPSSTPSAAPATGSASRVRLFRTTAFRLALVYITVFGTSALILVGLVYWITFNFVERQTVDTLIAEIEGLVEHPSLANIDEFTDLIGRRSAPEIRGDRIYVLTNPDYTVRAGNLDAWPSVPEDVDGLVRFTILRIEDGKEVIHPVEAMTVLLPGRYRLLVGRDMNERVAVQTMLQESFGWLLIVTLSLGLAGGVFVSRRMLGRVEAINRTTERIMQGDLHERIALKGADDEFDELSSNLNAMLDQIERLMAGMRDVTDNIAHDLRSPLTRIKARLEQVLTRERTLEEYKSAIDQAILDADRLLGVFSALLSIATVETGALQSELKPVDLNDLVQEVAELYEPAVEDAGMMMIARSRPGAIIKGHRQLLMQAMANLIDNAIKYAGGSQRVDLVVSQHGHEVDFFVGDNGPGIPEDKREYVLQRSARLDPARSTVGNGLGLAMVAAVAKLHGAALTLEDNEPGLRVRMSFRRMESDGQREPRTHKDRGKPDELAYAS
ncbi:MAG: HAMP domain-containing sensor histidine kinase [Alphaproteobacteria bacterium]